MIANEKPVIFEQKIEEYCILSVSSLTNFQQKLFQPEYF